MGLAVGIVGLPNVGKSTLFNALTKKQQAAAENYPFCTIEPNSAIVEVADQRLEKLAELAKPEQIIRATVEFTDIAGLVKGIKRHPNVEDNVVIYAGATILGGDTTIGHDSEIGGSVWLIESVPPNSRVYNKPPAPEIREKVVVGSRSCTKDV